MGLAALGAGGFLAWSAFFGVGDQPAEALPAGTLGYVGIDADPSGAQKIEALRTLNKFPGIKDEIGLASDGDIKRRIFEEILNDGSCENLDYADDIEPWLGDRFAVAAVEVGEAEPAPVFVVQVSDASAADEGFTKLRSCGGESGDSQEGGWAIEDGWALVAETADIAAQVVEARGEGTLADDADFQKWTDSAGDPGIITAYAAPAAGAFFADAVSAGTGVQDDFDAGFGGPLVADVPEEFLDALQDFGGAGMTVRFDDGALEMETASSLEMLGLNVLTGSDRGAETIGTMPENTAAAFGIGFADGWFDDLVEYASTFTGGEVDLDEIIAQIEDETGLSLPEDAETLAGESLAFAISADVDADTFFNSADGSDVPVGVKIRGDADEIEDVLGKLVGGQALPENIVGTDDDDGFVVIGPNPDYREELLRDGGLGDTDVFKEVTREDGPSAVLFVNFDAGDNWLADLVGDDQEVRENIEPLAGLGISAWSEDEVGHSVLRITTD